MPELPEVETTACGIRPHIVGQTIREIAVRQRQLRHPVTRNIRQLLMNMRVKSVTRRGKYVLIYLSEGCVIIHLGMSGRLRVLRSDEPAGKHDHVDIIFSHKRLLRFTDPRRFGCVLYTAKDPLEHKLLSALGPEPFDDQFSAEYLHAKSVKRSVAVKNFIMNSQIVVGVGNIYASESLFRAGILPHRQAGRISLDRYTQLCKHIREVLAEAIKQGGTTLRDFTNSEGNPGYFQQKLDVYGREHQACNRCGKPIRLKVIGQRSSFYCTNCQS